MKWVLYGHRKGSVLDDSWPMAHGTKNGTLDSDRCFCRSIFFTKIIFPVPNWNQFDWWQRQHYFKSISGCNPALKTITCHNMSVTQMYHDYPDRIAAFFTLFQRSYSWKPCHHEVQNIRDVIPFPRYPGHVLSIRWIIGNRRVVVLGFTAALMDGSWPNSITQPSGL